MFDRRTFIHLLGGLALAACNKSSTASGPRKVKLALNWVPEPEFGGFYAARANGAFAKENLDVEIQGGGAGVPVVQMVATGQVDFGIAGADEILNARAKGADLVALMTTYQMSPQALMAHASRGAKSIADLLSSGTLAIEPGLPYARWLKKKHGDFKAKVVPYDGGVARFVADKDFAQQCYVTSEPIAAKRKGSDPQTFLIADDGYDPYVGVVVMKRSAWNERGDVAKAFVRAAQAGWRAYLDDPAPANAIMQKLNSAMDLETFAAAAAAQKPLLEDETTAKEGFGAMTRARWDELAKQLVDLGVLEKREDSAAFLVNTR